ncbi:MAG TPA: hypothetical protein VMT03_13565 [Polyangia bacterium]|nr:hypothetical protein [Polyangia bacterium]
MTPAVILLVALVAEDPAVLRNAPRDDAPAQATLWRGDWVEVRGETAGFLRVYDHRHERPGYLRPSQVRQYPVDAASAPEAAAIVRFLRDASGFESLGIGYAALALRASPAGADQTELLAAVGTMAERLARRASARKSDAGAWTQLGSAQRSPSREAAGILPGFQRLIDATLAAHLEVAASYGVSFKLVEPTTPGGRALVCYDGEAWAQVLATPNAAPVERARAALSLSVDPCADPAAPPAVARAFNDRRLQALTSIDFVAERAMPTALVGRVRLRRAEAYAWRAFDQARQGQLDAAARAEGSAVRELALTDRGVLAPEDGALYEEAAVRVAASRWAGEPASADTRPRPLAVAVAARGPGESCVRILERATGAMLGERCTFGVVWANALRWAPSGTVATLAVQPLPAWTELWVLRRGSDGKSWTFDALTPAVTDPDRGAGYVEAAGTSPDGGKLLVVREAHVGGRASRRFQVLSAPTLAVDKWADDAGKLLAFKRWSSPAWRASTLALR